MSEASPDQQLFRRPGDSGCLAGLAYWYVDPWNINSPGIRVGANPCHNKHMKIVPREQGNQLWTKLWDGLTTEWFKVEVLQDYSAEDKGLSLDAWRAGDKERSIELLHEQPADWTSECRAKVQAGVKLIRIHVVDYPLSEYVQWEIEVYKNRNVPLGNEEVYLVDRADLRGIDLPAGDMMMFDQKDVVINSYDETGYAYEQTFYGEDDDIERFVVLRRKLLAATRVKI